MTPETPERAAHIYFVRAPTGHNENELWVFIARRGLLPPAERSLRRRLSVYVVLGHDSMTLYSQLELQALRGVRQIEGLLSCRRYGNIIRIVPDTAHWVAIQEGFRAKIAQTLRLRIEHVYVHDLTTEG